MSDAARDQFNQRLALTDRDVARRKEFVGLDEQDCERLMGLRELLIPKVEQFTATFFDYTAQFPEARPLFSSHTVAEEAKRLKREHLMAMVGGDYGVFYAQQRLRLGQLYSGVGLDARVFIGAFHHLLTAVGSEITEHFLHEPKTGFEHVTSFTKLGFFDIGIIVDVLVAERERTISLQQESIRELSTSVLQVRERLLILPIIGLIDSQRAKQLTDDLLRSIRANRAKVVVMDITGVAAVDSKVANHFIQTVAAARLMGTTVIITGLSPEVAQALVALGVDLGSIATVGDLQGGMEEAERMLGYKIMQGTDAAGAMRTA